MTTAGRIRPPMLKPGDTVGFIAPCWRMKEEDLRPAAEKLRELGFGTKYAKNLFSTAYGYAGSVKERADDFNAMIADPEVKMVLFGGGEVGNEILPYVDWDAVRANPKIICSYSDSTSILNPVTAMTGLVTFYGAAPRTFSGLIPYNERSFRARLCSRQTAHEKSSPWKVLCGGKCEGILTGGYLANYATLFASPYFRLPGGRRYVLLLEDHEMFSEPAIVSKWISNLVMCGAFEHVTGLIFGHYSSTKPDALDEILTRFGESLRIPVVRTDDFGHGDNTAIFPLGVNCVLDADADTFAFTESGVE